jgi:hypothetical protein
MALNSPVKEEGRMKKILILTSFAVFLLAACVVVPRHGVVAPYLPPVVVLDVEPYYYYEGFHYHYDRDRWYYSQSRSGPWYDLPRDHYPQELRFKGKGKRHGHDDRRHDD